MMDLALPHSRPGRSHASAQTEGVLTDSVVASTHVPASGGVSSSSAFADYFRCPETAATLASPSNLSAEEGYFTFDGTVCYGRASGVVPAVLATETLPDVTHAAERFSGSARLPFELGEVLTNLRQERYRQRPHNAIERLTSHDLVRRLYYLLRPVLPVPVRKHLQQVRLTGWSAIQFPRWPVDVSVETLMRSAMARVLQNQHIDAVPFIWFWPDGADACLMMTHDVEGAAGREMCPRLMDVDDSFAMKSAFQVVPETHCERSTGLIGLLRHRGFEVNLHDFNHDGNLFRDRDEFLRRAALINKHASDLGCRGFRSGAMYREQSWFEAFDLSYDMSVPNVAHLEPQRGGCCTVLPYFVGSLLELPLTTTQDYSLFHILGEYSIELWKEEIAAVLTANGLISFITHPDYLVERRALDVYRDLLAYLSALRRERNLWVTVPGDIDRWWRQRQVMTLVPQGPGWTIEGPGSERARLAYASVKDGRVVFELATR